MKDAQPGQPTAADQIARFLADNPDGRLIVAVGYATPEGVAWLHEHTRGRPVSLLVGNTQARYWKGRPVAPEAAEAAADFIRRRDVKFRNWYRTKKSRAGAAAAHLKAWVVESDGAPRAALVTAANLTKAGLVDNVELGANAVGDDLPRVWAEVRELHQKGWDCADRLLGYLDLPGSEVKAEQAAKNETSQACQPRTDIPPPPPSPPPHGMAVGRRTDRSPGESQWDGEAPLLASKGQRIGAHLLDALLGVITLGIGYIVWSLVIFDRGQTPAKQVLNFRVVSVSKRRCVGRAKMVVREWVLKGWLGCLLPILALTLTDAQADWFYLVLAAWCVLWLASVTLLMVDGRNRAGWDLALGTVVINDHNGAFNPRRAADWVAQREAW